MTHLLLPVNALVVGHLALPDDTNELPLQLSLHARGSTGSTGIGFFVRWARGAIREVGAIFLEAGRRPDVSDGSNNLGVNREPKLSRRSKSSKIDRSSTGENF